MISSAQQYDLPLAIHVSKARPLVPIDVAVFLLDARRPEDVEALIDDATLSIAWDLRSKDAERHMTAIYWRCLLAYMESRNNGGANVPVCPDKSPAPTWTDAEIYQEMLPSHWATVNASSLYTKWTCSQGHLAKLIDQGLLTAATEPKRGPQGSPKLLRSSVITFLQARRR
jgi:hypothetical protein